jgi:hypothetical protein
MTTGILDSIQQEIADLILADPFFEDIAVLTEHTKEIESEINRALGPLNERGGKIGAVVIVLTPQAKISFKDVFGPFFDDIKVVALVSVNPTVNNDASGTGKTASAIAEKVATVVHQQTVNSSNGPVVADDPGITTIEDEFDSRNVHFRTAGGVATAPPQVATPIIAEDHGAFTITCATPGAAIFYTLNGKNPVPRVGTFYSAPFSAGSDLTLKARAWLAGYIASETAQTTT